MERGKIKQPEEFTPEEKQTYENWERVLNKDELTVDDIKKFCQLQIDAVENKWKDFDVSKEKKAELINYHTVYKALLLAIDSPRSAREALEVQLQQMLQQ